jgi:hypothetical protein
VLECIGCDGCVLQGDCFVFCLLIVFILFVDKCSYHPSKCVFLYLRSESRTVVSLVLVSIAFTVNSFFLFGSSSQ